MDTSNNSFFARFYSTVNTDINEYRPDTTDAERNNLLLKAVVLLHEKKKGHLSCDESTIITVQEFQNDNSRTNIFMFRPLQKDYPLPHPLLHKHEIFTETSWDIYTNYMKTLDYLTGKGFEECDLDQCRSMIKNNDHSRILCWSNTSILLDKVLQSTDTTSIIITWGSPILVGNNTTNLYHEDDWILGFVGEIYGIDVGALQKNRLYTWTSEDGNKHTFVVFSRDNFDIYSVTEPHRYYYVFS